MTLDLSNLHASALVDTNFVRVMRRINAVAVGEMIDEGKILWVWDVAVRGNRRARELRFWLHEIVAPQMVARLSLEEVLNRILPPARSFFWAGEVCQILLISPVTLSTLARQLGAVIKKNVWTFSRARLLEWLRERWLGGARPIL